MKSEVYKRKVDTTYELIAHILDVVTGIKRNEEEIGRKKTAIFAHELRSALKLTVVFSYIYC